VRRERERERESCGWQAYIRSIPSSLNSIDYLSYHNSNIYHLKVLERGNESLVKSVSKLRLEEGLMNHRERIGKVLESSKSHEVSKDDS